MLSDKSTPETTTPNQSGSSLFPPSFQAKNIRAMHHNLECFVYPISKLDELALLMRKKNTFTARFLVDMNGILWFAEEGAPTKNVPAHYQMIANHASSAFCLTAGNIEFSHDYREIIGVNHKSGDFRPSYESLAVFFAIFLRTPEKDSISIPISLAQTLQVEKLLLSGGTDVFYNFTMGQLNDWCSSVKTISSQPTEKKRICYSVKREREIPEMPDFVLPPSATPYSYQGSMFSPADNRDYNTQAPILSLGH